MHSIDFVFIHNDKTVRAWLLSNPVLDDPLDLLVYCYRGRNDKRAETPPLHRINYLDQTDLRNWALDPSQHIGQMHSRAISDNGPVGEGNNDADGAHEDNTTIFSETSSDMSDFMNRSEVPFTIFKLPSPTVGVAKCPANRIPLLAKSLSQQNRQPPLNLLHPSAQGEYGPMHRVQFNDEDTPEKRHLNFLLKEFQRSDETWKRRAGIYPEDTEDPKSKRVCTGADPESLTGDLMDSMAH